MVPLFLGSSVAEFLREFSKPIFFSLRRPVFDDDILAFTIPEVYPMEDPKLSTTSCVRNPGLADHQRFPKFMRNKPIHLTLMEGEILFIPIFWWHFIQGGESINLSLSFHFFEVSPQVVASPYCAPLP
jgi:Cupin-like domain